MKKVLFIDRDGTLIKEYPPTYQIDALEKVQFFPDAFKYMRRIAEEFDFELVLVSNQDGLGTESFPESDFLPLHRHILQAFEGEGVRFVREHIDKSRPEEGLDTRKPGIGMLRDYLNNPEYDIPNSYVIGDRITDVQLARNLGCKALWINIHPGLGAGENKDSEEVLKAAVALETDNWRDIYLFLKGTRTITHLRSTSETNISIELALDGTGRAQISTGLGFFDHMLDQIARHGGMDLKVEVQGDLHIDEHHTVEDTALAFGETVLKALGDKRGIGRYGFALPMDEAEAKVLIDFGGRPWLVWNAHFRRERIGEVPTEMFYHFFKSFSDSARCNLNIECRGENEHHKIEAIFKAFAKAVRMAVRRDVDSQVLPSTKGVL